MGVSVNSAGSTTGAVAMAGTFGYELNLGKLSEEEKEEITAEKIIEQELLKANLQPVTPIVPPAEKETIKPVQPEQVSQPVSKKTAPVRGKCIDKSKKQACHFAAVCRNGGIRQQGNIGSSCTCETDGRVCAA
mgnify:CR=1 FL=1